MANFKNNINCWKAINIVSLLLSTFTFLCMHIYMHVCKCGVIMFQVEDKKEKLQEAQRFHFDAM